MAGTQIYNKDRLEIFPITEATSVKSNRGDVQSDLAYLFEEVAKLNGTLLAVNKISISVEYLLADTALVDEVKIDTREWSTLFVLPSEDYPYIWKRTKYSFEGATDDESLIIYEIVASDISTVIQTIYTRTDGETKPVIEYRLKLNTNNEPLYLDSSGRETTEVTDRKAYDYDYYYDGKPANKMDSLPPTPDGESYTWLDYPQDISPSYTRVFMSRRVKENGKWGPFSTPAQYGQWPTT